MLVTGGTGLLGWWLVKAFLETGFEVHATYHTRKPLGPNGASWRRLELADPADVARVFEEARPDVVVHAAAYTDVDGCERSPGLAYRVNYLGTLAVAREAARRGAFMVYVSTDYVFDGERGLYREEDTPRPINYYGLTKLLGEASTAALPGDSSLIVRVSGLYGYSPTGKRNFGVNALEALLEGRSVKAFDDQYLSPTYAPWLAGAIAKLVSSGASGVLHVAGERMSRYEFALRLAEAVGADPSLVRPTPMSSARLAARRPRDSSLDVRRAKALGITHPPAAQAIRGFVEEYLRARTEDPSTL
ncbi:MAG: dTDP-4-dehydrorhamnose reductase [Desulfurococcales archaeon]|nr:dTDP-4-dehydrorhamnose reductase [Desulfurococcales archaeon]